MQLRVLLDVALEYVLDVSEDVVHVEDVFGGRHVHEDVPIGVVLTLKLVGDELGCQLK